MTISKDMTVAVLGAGAMGRGIAQVAVTAGHRVMLFDAMAGVAEQARGTIVTSLRRLSEKGKMAAEDCEAAAGRLVVVGSFNDMSEAGLVIEAIAEDLGIKQALFREVEQAVSSSAILTTNTSSISVTAIGSVLKHPGRFAGFHFFNPAPLMKLVEIISGAATSESTLQELAATARAWGKVAVQAKTTPGFIVNRIARPFYGEALRLLEEGAADVATLDFIYTRSAGFRMGPFELMDMIGHDVNYAVTSTVFADCYNDPRYRPSILQRELVAAGWLGRKSGRGFYDHQGGEGGEPRLYPPQAAPARITVEGRGPGLAELMAACEQRGIDIVHHEGEGYLRVADAYVARSDGRSATQRVAQGAPSELVLVDLVDLASAQAVVLTKADQASESALASAAGLFQALGKAVATVDDLPGMVVLRTLALLIDEAADAAQKGIASPQDIETAMVTGVNYPKGLLSWGDAIGPSALVGALDHIRQLNGDGRYRVSEMLRRKALCAAPLAPAK